MKTIGFIGAGNMGGAMAKACAKIAENQVLIFDTNAKVYTTFENVPNIKVAESIEQLIEKCDYVVMSIKPQYYQEVGRQVKAAIEKEKIVITVAPSYSLEDLKSLLGEKVKIVRTMPNTPALVGEGITAYCYDDTLVTEEELKDFIVYFGSFGKLIKVNETLMAGVVAATGSSPAYVYMFIEAMADAAVSFGIPRQAAYEMVAQAVKGSAQMVLETGQHPGVLKDAVTSPAGTTIKAVLAMEEAGFRNSVIKGMEACYQQVIDMSKH